MFEHSHLAPLQQVGYLAPRCATKAAPHPRGSSSGVGHCPSGLRRAKSPIFLPSSSCLPRLQSFVPTYPPLTLTIPHNPSPMSYRFLPSYFKPSHPQAFSNPRILGRPCPGRAVVHRTVLDDAARERNPPYTLPNANYSPFCFPSLCHHRHLPSSAPAPQSGSPTSGLLYRTYVSTSRFTCGSLEPSTFWLLTSYSVVRSLSPDPLRLEFFYEYWVRLGALGVYGSRIWALGNPVGLRSIAPLGSAGP